MVKRKHYMGYLPFVRGQVSANILPRPAVHWQKPVVGPNVKLIYFILDVVKVA